MLPGASSKKPHDHIHKGKIKSYAYINAACLLEDFWNEVEITLKKEGITL